LRLRALLIACLFIVGMSATLCSASLPPVELTYGGALGEAGMTGTGGWPSSGMTLSWNITNWVEQEPDHDYTWLYTYTFTVPRVASGNLKEVSHFIVETSANVEVPPDIWEFQVGAAADAGTDIAWVSSSDWAYGDWTNADGKSNPGLPSALHGVKFDGPSAPDEATTSYIAVYSFKANRMPVWGDFYAKDGRSGEPFAYLYNVGFLETDPDPSTPQGLPVSGNQDPPFGKGKILRPDGGGTSGEEITPELSPGVLLLLGALPLGIAWRRRKRGDG